MFDKDNILKSPIDMARDVNLNEPIRLVLEDPHRERLVKLRLFTTLCAVFVLAAGLVLWVWGYPTQKNNPGFWQVALVSMLFWLSVSQGMVALSAVLRICHASWRYPLNRLLDMGSLFGVWFLALLPLFIYARRQIYNLGVSEHKDNVWRVAGSTAWDAVAVGTAFVTGWLLLYLTSLPDFAILRDRAPEGSKEHRFYQRMTNWRALYVTHKPFRIHSARVQWTGSEHQWRVLRRAEGVLVIGVLASFVGSQTVLGWDFQLAAARNWDSSIFAPLFTLGSLLGGTALIVLVITVVSRLLRGRGFIGEFQYDNLGKLMIGLGLIWFYFRFCDYLTAWYGHIPDEWVLQNDRTRVFPVMVGLMVFGCFVAPVFGNMILRIRRSVFGICAISAFILLGLAAQRYLDTVPTFAPKFNAQALIPTVPGFVVFLGLAAMFALTYLVGARYFPIMSWWGTSKERTRTAQRRMGNATVTVMVEDPPVWET